MRRGHRVLSDHVPPSCATSTLDADRPVPGVIGAINQVQREHRKHAVHVATTLRAQGTSRLITIMTLIG